MIEELTSFEIKKIFGDDLKPSTYKLLYDLILDLQKQFSQMGIDNDTFKAQLKSSITDKIKAELENLMATGELQRIINNELTEKFKEVVEARKDFKTLGKRLDNVDLQMVNNTQQLINKINEVATKGTTTEVLQTTTETYMQEKLNDGTIANLTIKDNTISSEKYKDESITPIKLNKRVYDSWLWDVNCRTISADETTYFSILVPKGIAIKNGKIKMYTEIDIDNYDLYNVSIAFFNATTPTNINSPVLALKDTEYPSYFTKTDNGVTITFEFSGNVATTDNVTCMIAFFRKDNKDTIINFKINNLKLNDQFIPKSYPYGLFGLTTDTENNVAIKTDNFCLARKKEVEELKYNFNEFKSRWYGKTINILGDSITAGVGATTISKRYTDLLANKLGCTINNYGISGTYLSHMANGNGFVDRFNSMSNVCDCVIVFGGSNDYWNGNVELNNFKTDLITLINGVNTKYVGKELYFVTPYNQYWQNKNSDTLNSANAKLEDYVNIIKEECKNHGIKVIDLFCESGMDIAHNSTHKTYFGNSETDGVHPNDNGHKKISDIIYLNLR